MRLTGLSVIIAIAFSVVQSSSDAVARASAIGHEHSGYLVKVAAADVPLEAIAGQILGPGWYVEITNIPGVHRLVPSSRDLLEESVADAWERVHRLHGQNAFSWVEPVFTNTLAPMQDGGLPVGECDGTFDKWGAPPSDPGALKDSQWSLGTEGANVLAAWKRFEGRKIQPGAGVTIGHPDTGFLEHPSLQGAILGSGFDFSSHRRGALDATDDGKLQWPGHGTRTSSVIAGRPFGIENGKRKISGVAPAARIMPMRVANRVVLLQRLDYDMGNLAMAIHAAAIGDPNFVARRADIISISLGGAPSRAVQDALKTAAEHDVLVLAAAGNKIPLRIISFPAAYTSAMAIAATNSSSRIWDGSSRGANVFVSAPGENVWTARRRLNGQQTLNCAEMGTGTSYAVATTAGVAALWLSFHQGDAAFEALPSRVAAFRKLVEDSARSGPPSGPEWDKTKFGAGIIDADELLKRALPGTAAAPAAKVAEDLQALSALLGADGEQRASALLWGAVPPKQVGHLADELAFLAITDQVVSTALVRLSSADDSATLDGVRRALLSRPLSPTLRRRLEQVTRVQPTH